MGAVGVSGDISLCAFKVLKSKENTQCGITFHDPKDNAILQRCNNEIAPSNGGVE